MNNTSNPLYKNSKKREKIHIDNIEYEFEIINISNFEHPTWGSPEYNLLPEFPNLGQYNTLEIRSIDWDIYINRINRPAPYIYGNDELKAINPGLLSIASADAYICFLRWALQQPRAFNIKARVEDLHWIWHDHYHAKNHVDHEYKLFVDQHKEYEAITCALEDAYFYMEYIPSGWFLRTLEEMFKVRFQNYKTMHRPDINLFDFCRSLKLEREGG